MLNTVNDVNSISYKMSPVCHLSQRWLDLERLGLLFTQPVAQLCVSFQNYAQLPNLYAIIRDPGAIPGLARSIIPLAIQGRNFG